MIEQSVRCPFCELYQKSPELPLDRNMVLILNCSKCHKQFKVLVWYQSVPDGAQAPPQIIEQSS